MCALSRFQRVNDVLVCVYARVRVCMCVCVCVLTLVRKRVIKCGDSRQSSVSKFSLR